MLLNEFCRRVLLALALIGSVPAAVGLAHAQDIRVQGLVPQKVAPPYVPGAELKVATRIIPPFVMEKPDGGGLEGFSVDLWQAIAAEAGLNGTFQTYGPLPALLDAVRTGANPVGIAAISITADRALVMDFSQPMFRSGLSILVPSGGSPTLAVFAGFLTSDLMLALVAFLALLLVAAHLFWLARRGKREGEWPVPRSYGAGIGETLSWAAEAMFGMASAAPTSRPGRLLTLVWKLAGVLLVAYVTALIATTLTVSSLRAGIEGPGDLIGKRVATVSGSTSARYLKELKADALEFDTLGEAVQHMLKGEAIASVYDTPSILYYARRNAGTVKVSGPPFRTEDYGIAFPAGSDLRPVVNAGLLKVVENGTYQAIYDKWFGSEGR